MSGHEHTRTPLWVVDGLADVANTTENLAEAIECAMVAADTRTADPADFMNGMLAVLLLATKDIHQKVATLHNEATQPVQ